jgi:peptidoglycan/xylan/chitin deacetylase (PgdA/CDA1 family)
VPIAIIVRVYLGRQETLACIASVVETTAGIATHFNDRNGTIDEFENMIRRQFDTLYEEGAQSGRVMAICLHPYLIGVPRRIAGLDRALRYVRSHAGAWFATGEEIVRH